MFNLLHENISKRKKMVTNYGMQNSTFDLRQKAEK